MKPLRYRLEIDNGKMKTYKGNYYIVDNNNNHVIYKKTWVIQNIGLISNASVSKDQVYLIKDKFERALKIVIDGMIRNILSPYGLSINDELHLAQYNATHEAVTKLASRPFVTDAWGFIGHYDMDTPPIFKDCLARAIKEVKHQGKQVWLTTDPGNNRRLFSDKAKAELFATKSRSVVSEV